MNPAALPEVGLNDLNKEPKHFDDDGSGNESDEKPARRSGRRKIKIEYIEDKNRRHITFSKRKAGIMKKAYELSTLTGTQVLLLVVSETGLVYTFTTVKLQPIVTKPEGKNLIQACLNAPDAVPGEASSGDYNTVSSRGDNPEKKMEATPHFSQPPPQQQQQQQQQQYQQAYSSMQVNDSYSQPPSSQSGGGYPMYSTSSSYPYPGHQGHPNHPMYYPSQGQIRPENDKARRNNGKK